MINDILDFSQISNGRLRLNPERFSISKIIKEVTSLLKFQAKNKGILLDAVNKLGFDGCPKSPVRTEAYGFIRSDPNRLRQVLLNLMGNALKFTQKGFVRLTVEKSPGLEGLYDELADEAVVAPF